MIPINTATYRESTGKSTIDLIFITQLLSKSPIFCNIAGGFDHNLEHQRMLSKRIMRITDNLLSLRHFLK